MSHARSRHLGNAGNGRTIYHRAQITGDPNGNRAQRRAWAKSNPAGAKPNQTARGAQNGPEGAQHANPDREARDGRSAAHGAAWQHGGHSADDTEELACVRCGKPLAVPTFFHRGEAYHPACAFAEFDGGANFRDSDDEHYPWHYTEHGVLCVCGQPMNADEKCPAAPDSDELACPHCRMASPTHDPGCITGLTAAFDTIHTERTDTP